MKKLFFLFVLIAALGMPAFAQQNTRVTSSGSGSFPNGAITPLGNTTDAKCTATDTTAEGVVCLLKQLSFLLQNALTVSGTVQVGNTPNTTPILSSINAGGNTAAVTAASTAAVATDKALVVTASPNSFQFSCTDRSGSITTGGTAQTAMSSNANRQRLFIENYVSATTQGISAAESLFISITGTATLSAGVPAAGVYEIPPGATFDFGAGPVSTQAISINAVTTGHKFAACEQ